MPTTVVPAFTSFVTTDPAPVIALDPTLIGAINLVSLPINAPSSMIV